MSNQQILEAELPLDSASARLLRGREAAGMSRAQVAAATKIPERHLAAIEAGNFAALPARTYAVAFSRSYAKAVGLPDGDIAEAVRTEMAWHEPEDTGRSVQSFEPGDPARVPASRTAWLAALAALVVILLGFAAWRSYYVPGGDLPSLLPSESPAPAPAPTAAAPVGGPVVFTAQLAGVWVKFTDPAGNQLLQKELALGESWTVPASLPDVRISTARPDALAITIGGQPVAKLSDVQVMVNNAPVTAAALLARGTAIASPAAQLSPLTPQSQPRVEPRRVGQNAATRASAPRSNTAPLSPASAAPAPLASEVAPAPAPAAPSAAPATTADR